MFEEEYLNQFNYDNHFLNNNFNKDDYMKQNEEIEFDPNDNTDDVINNSKKQWINFYIT